MSYADMAGMSHAEITTQSSSSSTLSSSSSSSSTARIIPLKDTTEWHEFPPPPPAELKQLEISKAGKFLIHGTGGKIWSYHHWIVTEEGATYAFSVRSKPEDVTRIVQKFGSNREAAIHELIPLLLFRTSYKTTRTILELQNDGKLHAIAQFGASQHRQYMAKLNQLSGGALADADPRHGHRPDRDPG